MSSGERSRRPTSGMTKVLIWRVGLVAGTLMLWEVGTRVGFIDPFFFPQPSAIGMKIVDWFSGSEIYLDLLITVYEAAGGFIIGTLVGIGLGLWLALRPFASQVMEPFIKAFNAIPRIVLAPIFTLWFGLGVTSKIAIVVTLVFFVAFFNTYQGVKEVNPVVLANARLLKASQWNLLRHVYLPSATSWILSSLRTSIGFAVTGAVVGEYLGSALGIGHVIAQAEGAFDSTGVFAGLVVLGAFVLLLDRVVDLLERRLLYWQPRTIAAE
jgi:NitT/TauT family transport system permease protein